MFLYFQETSQLSLGKDVWADRRAGRHCKLKPALTFADQGARKFECRLSRVGSCFTCSSFVPRCSPLKAPGQQVAGAGIAGSLTIVICTLRPGTRAIYPTRGDALPVQNSLRTELSAG